MTIKVLPHGNIKITVFAIKIGSALNRRKIEPRLMPSGWAAQVSGSNSPEIG